jgi:hypothetical protein
VLEIGAGDHGFYAGDAGGANAAAATYKVGKLTSTGRSINAGGTVNASGADYAEYERKADGCGQIAKGQIVGFDADGCITDKWSLARGGFGIKSTNPSYVGGDSWGIAPPEKPAQPEYIEAVVKRVPVKDARGHTTIKRRTVRQASHSAAELAAAMAKYETDMAVWREAMDRHSLAQEAARQAVDRIAYSGKVPVNLSGASSANIGWYVLASKGGRDTIVAEMVEAPSPANMTRAVGRIRKIISNAQVLVAVLQS